MQAEPLQPGRTAAHVAAAPILTLDAVSKHFGALKALNELSFDIQRGEILARLRR